MNAPETAIVELDAQYRQLREECGLLDRSERGKLLVSGPDGAEYLQGQLTNDVEALEAGEGQYAALLDRKGHIQADMRRCCGPRPKGILVDTEPVAHARRRGDTSRCTRSAATSRSRTSARRGRSSP